ncbi:hypothetical protein LIER_09076 [Lithospermum erythrorhizon]|uniref:RNase H type-1 domain-containing protein n=1 Tax=Lithospermum erythrorhizon TaxID=34254 RepID=A0AAV3PI99_LITER
MEHVARERNQEADRFSQLAMPEYGLMHSSTSVEWVTEEAFRMKEVINNASKDEGSTPRPSYQDILEFMSSGILPKKIQR